MCTFFHNIFPFTNIYMNELNKISSLMVPPVLGPNEVAGGVS